MITDYRGLLADWQIAILAKDYGMIQPFTADKIRKIKIDGHAAVSYGLSTHGYDITLSGKEFFVLRHVPGTIINPKRHNPDNYERLVLQEDEDGQFFVLPAHSYGLGTTPDRLKMPENVQAQASGKSTYVRCGIVTTVTPAEAGWVGHLTLEFSNCSAADCRLYVGEGVCQLVFYATEPPKLCYVKRGAKYQDQPERVVFGRA
jgi:dCTP deaminase